MCRHRPQIDLWGSGEFVAAEHVQRWRMALENGLPTQFGEMALERFDVQAVKINGVSNIEGAGPQNGGSVCLTPARL